MAKIRVAIDNVQNKSADQKTLDAFAEKLRAAGHDVTTHGVGPNKIQSVMRKSSNQCDLMIQIAGGKCIGTWGDFVVGLQSGYYHAKAGGFAYYKCWDANWKAHREPRDTFSNKAGTKVKAKVDSVLGKTLPECFSGESTMFYGYGNTAEELAKTFLNNYSGGGGSESGGAGGGASVLDCIKQVVTDIDPYGPELQLHGDTLYFKRSNPNTAAVLDSNSIINNSISINDYDNSTPNSYRSTKDPQLVERFGEIPLDDTVNSIWEDQVLLMGQRGHNHSIDLKTVFNKNFLAGRWVKLNLPEYNIINKPYFINRCSFDEDWTLSISLEPGPPSLHVDITEEATEEETSEETNGTEA